MPTDRAMKIKEWCALRGYSIASYYNLRKIGRGPQVVNPGAGGQRITPAADAKWERDMLRWGKEDEARKAAERKSAQTAQAGRTSAKSTNHIWQQRAAAKRLPGRPRKQQSEERR